MGIVSNWAKTGLLLGGLTGLFLLVGRLVGGATGMTIAIIFAVVMNIGTYFFSDKIVLKMYRAYPADKKQHAHLYEMVADICKRMNLEMPRLYIVPAENLNAFATGRDPQNAVVACTEGILKALNDKELKGVLAHECSHIKNRDILIGTIAATIAGVISYVAAMARWAAIFGGAGGRDRDNNAFEFLALAIVTPLIATILQLAISRSREYLADASGARALGDGEGLASALEKLESYNKIKPMKMGSQSTASIFISNPFKLSGFSQLFSTHPKTKERIKRLRSGNF